MLPHPESKLTWQKTFFHMILEFEIVYFRGLVRMYVALLSQKKKKKTILYFCIFNSSYNKYLGSKVLPQEQTIKVSLRKYLQNLIANAQAGEQQYLRGLFQMPRVEYTGKFLIGYIKQKYRLFLKKPLKPKLFLPLT